MFGLQILDIAIGLIFVYLLLALICTAASELFAGLFERRARNLFIAISHILEEETVRLKDPKDPGDPKGKGLADLLYAHPLVTALHGRRLWGRGKVKPSYIPSRTFALALLDIIAPANPEKVKNIEDIRAAIKALPADSDIRRSLLVFLDEAEADLGKLRKGIEAWFNDAMDRVSGWYKQRTQVIVFIIATVVTTAVNADTIQISRVLANDRSLREVLVTQAQESARNQSAASQEPPAASTKPPADIIKENLATLRNLGLKLDWHEGPGTPIDWVNKIFGLLLTALAVSLGAPFWFDTLNRIITIRTSGKPPKESPEPLEAPARRREEVLPE